MTEDRPCDIPCYRCVQEFRLRRREGRCPNCGNKRCRHAVDHRLGCLAIQKPYRPVIAGKRCFECSECGHTWDERTRDIDSPSGVDCPECGDWVTPLMGLPDPTQDGGGQSQGDGTDV